MGIALYLYKLYSNIWKLLKNIKILCEKYLSKTKYYANYFTMLENSLSVISYLRCRTFSYPKTLLWLVIGAKAVSSLEESLHCFKEMSHFPLLSIKWSVGLSLREHWLTQLNRVTFSFRTSQWLGFWACNSHVITRNLHSLSLPDLYPSYDSSVLFIHIP